MAGFLAGLGDYLSAHRILFKQRLWPLFLVPGFLSLLYLPLSVVFGAIFLKDFTEYLHDNWVPEFLQSTIMLIFLGLLLLLVGVTLGFILFRNVIMILYSPILSFLSEATEAAAGGKMREEDAPPFSMGATVKSAARGTSMSVLTLVYSLLGLTLGFLIGFIPIIGAIVAAIFVPLVMWFLAGVGFYDPALDRRQVGIGGAFRFCWKDRGRVIGQGAGFTLLLMIPVVGWFLAPSYGVVAGTLGVLATLEKGAEASEAPVDES